MIEGLYGAPIERVDLSWLTDLLTVPVIILGPFVAYALFATFLRHKQRAFASAELNLLADKVQELDRALPPGDMADLLRATAVLIESGVPGRPTPGEDVKWVFQKDRDS